MEAPSPELVARIKKLYHLYRHTTDLGKKGLFFSRDCLQICRPMPSYAAVSRSQIVEYLHDVQQGKVPISSNTTKPIRLGEPRKTTEVKGVYTIRPLKTTEFEFGSDFTTQPVSMTTEELNTKARLEEWVGMRVDLWDQGVEGGLMVKVQYWWRLEDVSQGERITGEAREWRQCLHDIMYLGPKDGTETALGLEVLE
ncbi:hypothetical protein T440DRAFT_440403 [Plenodomus tracheiphilus IPT5]|uniref:SnoaL-like domain-containing protein n=1 Tax=Plenodomus tracheiphilus IPT5 TaxID=1408161 RepID=A0A6A7BKK1_9PLEO|nr:hypothetical protein T440DRAFT_440403 [Plenodomus tracheiphilus IPT5]